MRNTTLRITGILALVFAWANLTQAASNTVDYYLTTPEQFKNMMVNLDVRGVRPVDFKSPIPELAFFHMMTWDKQKNAPGGHIMLVAPAANATSIMRKYGAGMHRGEIERMRGVLILSPGGPGPEKPEAPPTNTSDATAEAKLPHHPGPRHQQRWMIDFEGLSGPIMDAHKAEMEKLHKLQQDNPPPPPATDEKQ